MITGGARGIGHATALAFARRGANIVICDVAEHGDETLAAVEKLGAKGFMSIPMLLIPNPLKTL